MGKRVCAGKCTDLHVRVRSVTYQAENINSYELVPAGHFHLPPFEAGSHIDVFLPGGIIRQYSLCNDPSDRDRYVIGVQKEEAGRGGSKLWHKSAQAGAIVEISPPRNNFPLCKEAENHLLLAGGIGITPMMAMLIELRRMGRSYELHYCTRCPEKTAFLEVIGDLAEQGSVHIHHDEGDPARGVNIAALLAAPRERTALYYCGPPGFMAAVREAATSWPSDSVHFEYFEAPDEPKSAVQAFANGGDGSFHVRLNSSGEEFYVPSDKSIVEVLRENGVEIATSCEAGVCRTCLTRYLEGEPEHHDYVLEDEERGEFVLPCCARALSETLVLDL